MKKAAFACVVVAGLAFLASGWMWCYRPATIHEGLVKQQASACCVLPTQIVDWMIKQCHTRAAVRRYEVYLEESAAKRKPAFSRFASMP